MGSPTASRADVARLLGRVAFGATKTDLDVWTGRPYADLVDFLLQTPADTAAHAVLLDEGQRINLETNARFNIADCQRWWLGRMATTLWPLEERMTLFWHDHFATAYGPLPFARAMMIQNQMLRKHALGNLRDLVNAVTIDCAMLDYLNGSQNYVIGTNRHVNENYAREFFELFTLGTLPQVYTEFDIEQAARAFTGWFTFSNNASSNDAPNSSRFAATRHDHDPKRVLGITIGGPGADEAVEYRHVAEVALSQTIAPYWFAYKLVQNFGYEPVVAGGDLRSGADPVVDAVAAAFRINNWAIKPAVRTMLMHDGFRSAPVRRVRMPAELIAHAAKVTNVNAGENTFPQLYLLATRMGQSVFQPPNVAGWPNGDDWLSQSTMVARYDLGPIIFPKWGLRGTAPASGDINAWVALVGLDAISASTRASISAYLTARAASTEAVKQAGVLSLLLSSPDWQVM